MLLKSFEKKILRLETIIIGILNQSASNKPTSTIINIHTIAGVPNQHLAATSRWKMATRPRQGAVTKVKNTVAIADKGPRTETSDSIKLLIHAMTS